MSTETGQPLGPRNFLALPELSADSTNKRQPTTDVTHCVGLLFFLLTGNRPINLTDQHGHKPHERKDAKEKFSQFPTHVAGQLNRIFGGGFREEIIDRWQTAEILKHEVQRLLDPPAPIEPTFDEHVRHLRDDYTQMPEYRSRARLQELFRKTSSQIDQTANDFLESSGGVAKLIFERRLYIQDEEKLQRGIAFVDATDQSVRQELAIVAGRDDEEFLLAVRDEWATTPDVDQIIIERCLLTDPDVDAKIRKAVEDVYLASFEKLLEKRAGTRPK